MIGWFRRDRPDYLVRMRELWQKVPHTAKTCHDEKDGQAWDRPDGRERMANPRLLKPRTFREWADQYGRKKAS